MNASLDVSFATARNLFADRLAALVERMEARHMDKHEQSEFAGRALALKSRDSFHRRSAELHPGVP